MKYIVFQRPRGQEIPFIFPAFLVHSSVAMALLKAVLALGNASIVAAGTCEILCLRCSGASETLNLASRNDQDRIMINCYGYSSGLDVPNNTAIETVVMISAAKALVEVLNQ